MRGSSSAAIPTQQTLTKLHSGATFCGVFEPAFSNYGAGSEIAPFLSQHTGIDITICQRQIITIKDFKARLLINFL
jgi:hypothetical protein